MEPSRKGEYYLSVIKQRMALKAVVSKYPYMRAILENKKYAFRANTIDGLCYIDALGSNEYYNIIADVEHGINKIQMYVKIMNDASYTFVNEEQITNYLKGKYAEITTVQ